MWARVAGATSVLPLTTLDTVGRETPAAAAMLASVGLPSSEGGTVRPSRSSSGAGSGVLVPAHRAGAVRPAPVWACRGRYRKFRHCGSRHPPSEPRAPLGGVVGQLR